MKKAGNNPEGERARASRLAITVVEIVLLAVVMLMVYAGGVLLLFDVINRAMGDWFFSPLGIFVVVGIDIVWVAWVIRWQLKNARIKIILTAFVLTLSASVLTCLVVLSSLGDMMW